LELIHVWKALYDWFMIPHRIVAVRRHLSAQRPLILDVGCGNHSPRITKCYLPSCVYHGVDNGRWNLDEQDDRCMDRFYRLNIEAEGALAVVPDGQYDAALCSHVLEHLDKPYELISRIAAKVKPGGTLYVETPSPRSLRLPRTHDGWLGVRGCLSFYDDETHRAPVDLGRVAGILCENGFRVRGPSVSRLWRRVFFLPLYLAAVVVAKRFIPASLLWDVTGFADCLTAEKNALRKNANKE
jgi:SAM-dependent methyltransferase